MHLDIWSPGTALHNNQEGFHLINDMCDLTHFIISSIIKDTKAESLANFFMKEVVLSFFIIAVVVVDADIRFRGAFGEMCKFFQIKFCPLERRNHKGNTF